MIIDKNERLREQQNKWDGIIFQTEHVQKKMLELMIELRKEIASLSRLKKDFPESVRIDERIAQCDQLLEQSLEILNDIKKQLPEFKKEKESLDQSIKKNNALPTSQQHDFRF